MLMTPLKRFVLFSAIFTLALFQAARSQHHDHQHGKVNFKTSCHPTANQRFTTGLALLHHMMYEQAEAEFTAAAKADAQRPSLIHAKKFVAKK
jgi:hypothetical protein